MTIKRFGLWLLIVFSVIIFNYSTVFGKPVRILILPFAVHSDKDLSFLKEGVGVMLSTRLAQEGKVLPLGKAAVQKAIQGASGPFDEQKIYQLGAQLEAEYVVLGTITVFGESISTDARFLDVRNRKPVVTFSQFGKSQGDVLYHINLFAAEVNEKVFGRKTSVYRKTETPKAETERRKHPDTLIRTDRMDLPSKMGSGQSDIWRSRKYKTSINGIIVADVDGDGNNETVFIGKHRVYIHRIVAGRFSKIKEIAGRPIDNYIRIDVADINQNGIPEIFITNHIDEYQTLSSFVLEWNGKTFKRISSKSSWYFRVLRVPGEDIMLLGQKRGIEKAFSSRIYKLKWINGRYESVERFKLPKGINLYSFTYGDFINTGKHLPITFTDDVKLKVFDHDWQELWTSNDRYGGSSVYVEFPMESSASIGDVREMDRLYLPQRIYVVDLDRDGKKEVVVIRNYNVIGRFIKRIRFLENGQIDGLMWDQSGLNKIWSTKKFSGPIIDFAVGDMDNDQQVELVFSIIEKSNLVLGGQKSYIVMMELSPSKKSQGG